MKKYILLSNGKEVKVGDTIKVSIKLSDDLLSKMIEEGVIQEKEYYPTDVSYYIQKAAKYLDMPCCDVDDMLSVLVEKYPLSALQILLKTISIEMTKDVNYAKLNGVYAISLYEGFVYKIDKCKNYRIAWFDTEAKAKLAKKILKPFFDAIYGK